MAIKHKGEVAVVLECQHRTPGNLRAFVQATLRSIRTGKSFDIRLSSTEKIEVVPLDHRKMEYSYRDGDDFVFTDPETYEPVTITPHVEPSTPGAPYEVVHIGLAYISNIGTATVYYLLLG